MRYIMRAGIVSAATTGMLAAGGLATTASAQPVNVGNLVNVNISNVNVLNDNEVVVTVPVNAAANICGVDLDVLLLAQSTTGVQTVECDARGNQTVSLSDVTS